jgi:N-acetylneuraminate synthase
MGACILEKHFTHDKTLLGNDHYHSMDKDDLKRFHRHLDEIIPLIGTFEVIYDPLEEPARKNARRSLVAKRDIPIGKAISSEDLTWKRPGSGICPKYINEVLGKVSVKPIKEDSILTWESLK